jgi:hypothetical protein
MLIIIREFLNILSNDSSPFVLARAFLIINKTELQEEKQNAIKLTLKKSKNI